MAGPLKWTKLVELTSEDEPDVPDIPEDPDEPDVPDDPDEMVSVKRSEIEAVIEKLRRWLA